MKKKLSFLFLILNVIGIVLIICGIKNLVTAATMEVPAMGQPNWFDLRTQQSHLQATGGGLIAGGFMLNLLGIALTLAMYKTHDIRSQFREAEKSMKTKDIAGRVKETLNSTTQSKAHSKCKYCGAKLPSDSLSCPNCGAKQ